MKPKIRIYDNNGKTRDRYTVVFVNQPEYQPGTYAALGMDDQPFSPQGIGMSCIASPGRHLGKRIELNELPIACQKLVNQYLRDIGD